MEWDLKLPLWDFTEVDSSSKGMECSVDLKPGGLTEIIPTSSGSLKRGRSVSNGNCLVDGCKADLSNCKEYHRRHKVCEAHSKTPMVTVGGQQQRFCQQCSRFHLLIEFDEEKRSCRKRLDGHNMRRRKPQPDAINSSRLFCYQRDTRFSYPQIFPSGASNPYWPASIKPEENIEERPREFNISFTQPFKEDAEIFVTKAKPKAIIHECLHYKTMESGKSKIFSDDFDRALSLLSIPGSTSGLSYSSNLAEHSHSQ